MNSQDLNSFLFTLLNKNSTFPGGVFPRDFIPSHFQHYPVAIICNTDTHEKPGKHWVAFYFVMPNEYEFFDSYGMHPSFYNFSYNHPTFYNTVQLQSNNSAVCGQFCLFFLEAKSRGISHKHFLHSFSHSLSWNDKIVRKFIQQITHPLRYAHLFNSINVVQSCCSFIDFNKLKK